MNSWIIKQKPQVDTMYYVRLLLQVTKWRDTITVARWEVPSLRRQYCRRRCEDKCRKRTRRRRRFSSSLRSRRPVRNDLRCSECLPSTTERTGNPKWVPTCCRRTHLFVTFSLLHVQNASLIMCASMLSRFHV